MDLKLFRDTLERLGPRLAAWPAEEQAAARALLAISPEARDSLAAARLERGLEAALGPVEVPAHLAARLASIPAIAPAASPWWRRLLAAEPLAVAGGVVTLTAAALLGVWIGAGALAPPPDDAAALLNLLDASVADLGDAS